MSYTHTDKLTPLDELAARARRIDVYENRSDNFTSLTDDADYIGPILCELTRHLARCADALEAIWRGLNP